MFCLLRFLFLIRFTLKKTQTNSSTTVALFLADSHFNLPSQSLYLICNLFKAVYKDETTKYHKLKIKRKKKQRVRIKQKQNLGQKGLITVVFLQAESTDLTELSMWWQEEKNNQLGYFSQCPQDKSEPVSSERSLTFGTLRL